MSDSIYWNGQGKETMLKHSFTSSFLKSTRPGDSIFIYPLYSSVIPYSRKEILMPELSSVFRLPHSEDSSYQINIPFKQAEFEHTAVIKNKIAAQKTDKKGILKVKKSENYDTMSRSTNKNSDSEYTISRRRKHSGSTTEKPKICLKENKKKVKFDDKYNRLHAIERKYRIGSSEKVLEKKLDRADEKGTERQQDGVEDSNKQTELQRLATRVSDEKYSNEKSSMEITEIYELPVPTYDISSVRSQPKSSTISGLKEMENSKTPPDIETRKERRVCHNDVRIAFDDSCEAAMEDLVITNGNCMGVSHDRKLKDLRDHKALTKSPKLSFSNKIVDDTKSIQQKTEMFKSSKFHKVISGKTVINTEGGATVTRSRVRPSMFSLLTKEIIPAPMAPRRPYKNFCDEGKTDLIVRWIQDVSNVQAKEGFCTLLHTEDFATQRNDN